MAEYYFIGVSLPDLQIGLPPKITFAEFEQLLRDNLNSLDYERVKVLKAYYDIENLRSMWKGLELDSRGNLDQMQLKESLLQQAELPSYVSDFLEKYESKEARLSYFSRVIADYFRIETEKASGILKRILDFERKMRLIQTAFRALKLGRNLAEELQFEDPEEDFIQQLFAQKEIKTFELPEEFAAIKPIFEEYGSSPLELHQALVEYRFHFFEKEIGSSPFSIQRILIYMMQLILVEKWQELDKEKGIQIIDKYVKEKV